jgi:hypothetical protein
MSAGHTIRAGPGIRLGGVVQDFIKSFVRDATGAWRCIHPATLDLPSGRIQVNPGSVFVKGTQFMNIDLAQLLDDLRNRSTRF